MAEQLPIITKSHAVNTTASPASSLLGRGLNAIQSRKSVVPLEEKLLPPMIQLMEADLELQALEFNALTFKESAGFVLDEIRAKFGDKAADSINIELLQASYLGAINQQTVKLEGVSSSEEVGLFNAIEELYLDDDILNDGIVVGLYYIERGAKKYEEYTQAMIEDLGEKIQPYLRLIYEGVRHYPDFDNSGMDDAETIKRIISVNQSKSDSQHD